MPGCPDILPAAPASRRKRRCSASVSSLRSSTLTATNRFSDLPSLPDDSEAARAIARQSAIPGILWRNGGSHANQDSSDSRRPDALATSLADNVRRVGRSVYVASPEGLTGKSAVALGLLDALTREVGSVGVSGR